MDPLLHSCAHSNGCEGSRRAKPGSAHKRGLDSWL
jgi:hypothetical protein